MLKNEELFVVVYRAWYAMLSTSRGMSTDKRKCEDIVRANVLCK